MTCERKSIDGKIEKKVKLISGGRKLYEPILSKLLKSGLLSAVVFGTECSAPSVAKITKCIEDTSCNGIFQTICIIPNSLEEIIHFREAIEIANSRQISAEYIEVGDDAFDRGCRRRTLAGLPYVILIAEKMIQASLNSTEICGAVELLIVQTVSCHLCKTHAFIGTGLEEGTGRFFDSVDTLDVTSEMIDSLNFEENCPSELYLVINSYSEFSIESYLKEILRQLHIMGKNVAKVYLRNFICGPNGFSVTVIGSRKEEIMNYVDATFSEYAWTCSEFEMSSCICLDDLGPTIKNTDFIETTIIFACEALISSNNVFNEMDMLNVFGDASLPALNALLKLTKKKKIILNRPYKTLNAIACVFKHFLENQNGLLYHALFSGMARAFLSFPSDEPVSVEKWLCSMKEGIISLKELLGPSNEPTLVDVLESFYSCVLKELESCTCVITALDNALVSTNKEIEKTFPSESMRKKKGLPEVTSQFTFVALISIVQGIRAVMNTLK